ncbi:hypothetical protein DL93DRAFT_2155977 [Clavulina sp. PMI_390]|nr:hypothetical protein DL93DRAFT_2155977 [Clavulina sp. PMI_390]
MEVPPVELNSHPRAQQLVKDKLLPLLIASGHIDEARAPHMNEWNTWQYIVRFTSELEFKGNEDGPVDYGTLELWIKGGIVKQLLDLIIELSPLVNSLFPNESIPAVNIATQPEFHWNLAITVMITICNVQLSLPSPTPPADVDQVSQTLFLSSIKLFTTWLAMDRVLARGRASIRTEGLVYMMWELGYRALDLVMPNTVGSSTLAERAEIAQAGLMLTVKVREFFTAPSSDYSAPISPSHDLSRAIVHKTLLMSAFTVQHCLLSIFGEAALRGGSLIRPTLSVSDLSGLPLANLVDQTAWVEHVTCASVHQQKYRRDEYGLLALMAYMNSGNTELIQILNHRSYLATTVTLMKTALADDEFLATFRLSEHNKDTTKTSDQLLPMYLSFAWKECLKSACSEKDIKVLEDAVSYGMMFVLELLSLYDLEEATPLKIYNPTEILPQMCTALRQTDENQSHLLKLGRQVAVINQRISRRPGVPEELISSWNSMLECFSSAETGASIDHALWPPILLGGMSAIICNAKLKSRRSYW